MAHRPGRDPVALRALRGRAALDRDDFGLRTDDPDALRAALTGELGIAGDQMINQSALKAFSMQVFELLGAR